ncbi:hypothetical protein PISMIDRAFT_685258 [Pisolithus microcarpus 441]|uniref:Uncharacterized protein n=1 Tax=Pisolithus microcarpus 441 TaxID=765257 RepID=A0A0C9XYH3_9AGAM|nr:hypothetical protein PISMIDRAFT_685258 [Pisolithus microcarpus 441]
MAGKPPSQGKGGVTVKLNTLCRIHHGYLHRYTMNNKLHPSIWKSISECKAIPLHHTIGSVVRPQSLPTPSVVQ